MTMDLSPDTPRQVQPITERPRRILPMHSMSNLPIARFCGMSPVIGKEHGAGRAAVMSNAFHALLADDPDALDKLRLLTDDEREEIGGWHRPGDCALPDGTALYFESADKEVELALDQEGNSIPYESEERLTRGRADFLWLMNHTEVKGSKAETHQWVYVADIKKSQWTTLDGPDSLQVHAAGFAACSKFGAAGYTPGIWHATEGTWAWGEPVDPMSLDGMELFELIRLAAQSPPEYITGSHCKSCWSRLYCQEYVLPVTNPTTALANLPNILELSQESLLELVRFIEAGAEVFDQAKTQLKEAVRRGLVVRDGNKVYRPISMTGREYVKTNELRAQLGEEAERFIAQGKPYEQFRWVKA